MLLTPECMTPEDVAALIFPLHVGDALRERRKSLGLTQVGFAARVGMKQAKVSRLERGTTRMSLQDLLNACDGDPRILISVLRQALALQGGTA